MKQTLRQFSLLLVLLVLIPALLPAVYGTETEPGEKIIYGYSGEGRELQAYRYGSGPNVLVMCFAIHGYEDSFDRDGQCLVECAWSLMEHLAENGLVADHGWTVYILPCLNPDGLASGYTSNGPGRCTTTYLKEDGTLSTDRGIDLNRCFPAKFRAMYDSRNYTTSRPMAALEAVALDAFLREVKGSGLNVLVDVHGWLQMFISSSRWLREAFAEQFTGYYHDVSSGGPGYLISHGVSLGYDSLLLELPYGIDSMDAFHASDIPQRLAAGVDNILRQGVSPCGGEHTFATTYEPPTCTEDGFEEWVCTQCGYREYETLPAAGHTPDWDSGTCQEPTATRAGFLSCLCGVCGETAETYVISQQFPDTSGDAYYADAVDYCYANGIVLGTSEHTFSPDAPCTRDQIVTFLWRAMGQPESTLTESPFVDVEPTDYYYPAVLWAFQTGITRGTGTDTFSPKALCTRGQIVTFLWRAMGQPESGAGELPFCDVHRDAYYYPAVLWACENGVTRGISTQYFAPGQQCTRAQAVTFLYRGTGIG